jgi:membrane protein
MNFTRRRKLVQKRIEHIGNRVRRIRNQAQAGNAGFLGIIIQAIQTFTAVRATQAAASIAYYALFSLFPLLLLLIAFGTTILKDERTVDEVLRYTARVLPTAQDLVRQNLQEVLELRGTVGLIAAVGLLWSATAVFDILARNINLAWVGAAPRNFLQSRLIGLMMVVILGALPLLSVLSTTLFSLLPVFDVSAPLWGGVSIYDTFSWQLITRFIPWFFTFLMFLSLYRLIPNVRVRWSEAIWGALVAAFAWEITKSGFTWFLSSGLASYRLIYGSLGTVVALMLWIDLSSVIILFGAHISGAITYYNNHPSRKKEK